MLPPSPYRIWKVPVLDVPSRQPLFLHNTKPSQRRRRIPRHLLLLRPLSAPLLMLARQAAFVHVPLLQVLRPQHQLRRLHLHPRLLPSQTRRLGYCHPVTLPPQQMHRLPLLHQRWDGNQVSTLMVCVLIFVRVSELTKHLSRNWEL